MAARWNQTESKAKRKAEKIMDKALPAAKEKLKWLRVAPSFHSIAKSNAAVKGLTLQQYIEQLIENDNK